MKLLYTPNSPYARRIRVAIAEAGLADRIEAIDIDPRDDNMQALLAHNPSGKVPLLVTDGGRALCESLVIAAYLDGLCGGALYPTDAAAREPALEMEGIASALMDSLFVRSRENRRDPAERSPGVIELEHRRAVRCYDALDSRIAGLGEGIDMAAITTACALGYADGRHPGDAWRTGRETLASWYAGIVERPSFATTVPSF